LTTNRYTIAGSAIFEGVGIHTGENTSVRISPLTDERGIYFGFGGRRYRVTDAEHWEARRSTTITFPEGRTVQTVEHLLSAVVGVGLDDVLIEPLGTEIPIMDGSAMPFASRILELGLVEKDTPKFCFALPAPVCVDMDGSSISAAPSDVTRITYVIDYPGTGIGTEMKDIILSSGAYAEEIAPARTFALQSEVDALRSSGLGLGGNFDNVTIIGDDGPLNRVGYRVDRECAAHKALDMLGDLALLGVIPKARYTCVRGGHRLHLKLMDRLIRMVRQMADGGR
jgi:UDP-3-O-[3-hydroxymyristoyl] N-acetylglucosamine deacetylase